MKSTSDQGQDIFARYIIDDDNNRTFVDIGCSKPFQGNNTAGLESVGWRGIAIDSENYEGWSERKARHFVEDATKFNWDKLGDFAFFVDYASIDVDAATNDALANFIRHHMHARVITIEHDSYHRPVEFVREQRQMLWDAGYTLICRDVTLPPGWALPTAASWEDWWVDSKQVDMDRATRLMSVGWQFTDVIAKIKQL